MNATAARSLAQHLTRATLAADVRGWYPASHELALRINDVYVRVATNAPELHHKLTRYFGEFLAEDVLSRGVPAGAEVIRVTAHEAPRRDWGLPFTAKQPDAGKRKIKEEYLDLPDGRMVHKRLTGMLFAFGHGDNMAVGPCTANDNQVVNFINNRYLELMLNRGCLLGHAAAVAHAGRGLAVAGFSGMGKSTLSLRLMSRGATFVSNDRVLVERGNDVAAPRCLGIPKQPRINPGTILANPDLAPVLTEEERITLSALPPDDLWHLERKYDAIIADCFGPGRFVPQAPLDALVILNWRRNTGEPLRVRMDSAENRPDLLPAFMKSTGVFYLPGPGGWDEDPGHAEYARGLAGVPIIELSGGVDFDAAADACMHFLATGTV